MSALRRVSFLLLPLAAGCAPAPAPEPGPAPGRPDAAAAVAMVEAGGLFLWPGFDPGAVAVAVFDGERTLLFRHPRPPAGFVALPGTPDAVVHPGRHPAVRANTTVEVNGVTTATVLLPEGGGALSPRRIAALIVHEAFHAFREARHPDWTANEVELFVYPVEDAPLLALRRRETEALRRALAAPDRDASECWARVALDLRRERFTALSAGAAAYERGTELNEGLARYVERRFAGAEAEGETLPEGGFPPPAVRERGYAAGEALARLLDRFDPAWAEALDRGENRSLDEALAAALPGGTASGCGFAPSEAHAAAVAAAHDVEKYRRERAERRNAFLADDGWRIVVVVVAGEPLWPERFDPLNVLRLDGGEVLHTRWIRLGGSAGSVEVLGRAALSEPAGAHPLFEGVRRLTVTGLPAEPAVRDSAGVVTVEADGVTARLIGSATREGRTLTFRPGGGSGRATIPAERHVPVASAADERHAWREVHRSPRRRPSMRSRTLLLLRVSLGLFLLVWGGDKLVNVEHGVAVSEGFYLGLLSSGGTLLAAAVLEIVLGALIVLGLARRAAYAGLLLITGATLLAVWRSILDPLGLVLEGGNPVFFSSLVIFAGSLVLFAFREEDVLSLDHRRSAYGRGSVRGESRSLAPS